MFKKNIIPIILLLLSLVLSTTSFAIDTPFRQWLFKYIPFKYSCFYDIDDKKLVWMKKTKPGDKLLLNPYDFYKGKVDDYIHTVENVTEINLRFVSRLEDYISAQYPEARVDDHCIDKSRVD